MKAFLHAELKKSRLNLVKHAIRLDDMKFSHFKFFWPLCVWVEGEGWLSRCFDQLRQFGAKTSAWASTSTSWLKSCNFSIKKVGLFRKTWASFRKIFGETVSGSVFGTTDRSRWKKKQIFRKKMKIWNFFIAWGCELGKRQKCHLCLSQDRADI